MLKNVKIIFLYFLFQSLLFPQNSTINVYHSDTETLIGKIEKRLIDEVIELHNKKEKKKYSLNYTVVSDFGKLLSIVSTTKKEEKDKFIAIGQITVTQERKTKYDFSIPYVPTKEVLISAIKNQSRVFKPNKNTKIGFLLNTIQEKSIQKLTNIRIKKIAFDEYTAMFNAIINNDIDYCLGDNIDVWNHQSLSIVKELQEQHGNGFSLLYIKNSTLKKELDPYIKYYLKSTKFKFFVERLYGKNIRDYFIKNLNLD